MKLMKVCLLGKVEILNDEPMVITLPLKAEELLVYLLVNANQFHEREKLALQLWPDVSEKLAKKYLRQSLWQVQSMLCENLDDGASVINLNRRWVCWTLDEQVWIDVQQFNKAFVQLRDVPAERLKKEQITLAQETISTYQGDLLPGCYQDWCLIERERYQSMYLMLLHKLSLYCLEKEQYEQGIEYAMQVLRYDRARESAHRQIMRLYYHSGDRTAALRQYKQCQNILQEDLSVRPSQKTTTLFNHIQKDIADPGLTGRPGPSTKPELNHSPLLTELRAIKVRLAAMQQDIGALQETISLKTLS